MAGGGGGGGGGGTLILSAQRRSCAPYLRRPRGCKTGSRPAAAFCFVLFFFLCGSFEQIEALEAVDCAWDLIYLRSEK